MKSTIAPLAAFQTRTVPSSDAVAIRFPSGEKATPMIALSCPANVTSGRPVATFQVRAVPSKEPVTMTAPSGEKATSVTSPPCPRMSRSTRPRRASAISTWCAEHTASRSPSGENAIPWFGPNFIRTMTSARSTFVMHDIMDHLTAQDTARRAKRRQSLVPPRGGFLEHSVAHLAEPRGAAGHHAVVSDQHHGQPAGTPQVLEQGDDLLTAGQFGGQVPQS